MRSRHEAFGADDHKVARLRAAGGVLFTLIGFVALVVVATARRLLDSLGLLTGRNAATVLVGLGAGVIIARLTDRVAGRSRWLTVLMSIVVITVAMLMLISIVG